MGCLRLTYRPNFEVLKGGSKKELTFRKGDLNARRNFLDEIKGTKNSYTTELRQFDPRIGRWLSQDPVTHPHQSPYVGFDNNPVFFTDPSGSTTEGHWYGADGKYIGDDGKDDDNVYITVQSGKLGNDDAKSLRVDFDAAQNNTGSSNNAIPDALSGLTGSQKLDISHDEFLWVAGVIKAEAGGRNSKETIGISHALYNRTKETGASLKAQLNKYSTVGDKDSKKLATTSNDSESIYAKKGLMHVLIGGKDVTNGATHWDGTDFLAWGLNSPNDTPHNKFEEYGTIVIDEDILERYVANHLEKYTNGRVRYSGKFYNLPAAVYLDENNLNNDGSFKYSYTNLGTVLRATESIGLSIFWKIEKK